MGLRAKARTRCSGSAEEKAEWLRLLEESGKPLSEFCRANGLPGSSASLYAGSDASRQWDPTNGSSSK